MQSDKAVFLDRDGTLIVEKNYLSDPAEVELEKDVIPALKLLQQKGYLLIIVTNQSGIGRGLFSVEDFKRVEAELNRQLKEHQITISKTYFCPHHPTEALPIYKQDCACRKPHPGMIKQGLQDFHLNAQKCFMIGDKLSDIGAGQALNIPSILVECGYGKEEAQKNKGKAPDFIATSLLQAAQDFIP